MKMHILTQVKSRYDFFQIHISDIHPSLNSNIVCEAIVVCDCAYKKW